MQCSPKSVLRTTVLCALMLATSVAAQDTAPTRSPTTAPSRTDAQPPNIVLIISDDAGYGDFSMHGSTEIPTPNIDSIAEQGVRFTQGYVSASVCSPSRAGLITGRYQQRFGHEFNIPPRFSETNGLPIEETTLADRLDALGYLTVAFGKWHLGYADHFHPMSRGFDHFYGFLQGARSFWPGKGTRLNRLLRDREPIEETFEYMTDALGDEAARVIASANGQPFFLYIAYNAVHTPMHATDDDEALFASIEPKKRRQLAAMTHAMDRSIGRVLAALDAAQVADNTIVIFVNDNGGATNNASQNGALRGRKGSRYEGGIRVPMVMRWPGVVQPGLVFDAPASTLDFVPTLVAAAGGSINADDTDGTDLRPFLRGDAGERRPHDVLHWKQGDGWAIRSGDWKLVHDGQLGVQLFDLAHDASEVNDVSADHVELVAQMIEMHRIWAEELVPPRWQGLRNSKNPEQEPKPGDASPAVPPKGNSGGR